MATFSFRKFLQCVASHYATCETYRDSGFIEHRCSARLDERDNWKVLFKTEFDRQGLFRFEWRDQSEQLTRHFPNQENVVWANKYGAFGRFDFEENTHHFQDLAQALESACVASSGVAPFVVGMLYPELSFLFEGPISRRRPVLVRQIERDGRPAVTIQWQCSASENTVVSRQVIFDLEDMAIKETFEIVQQLGGAAPPGKVFFTHIVFVDVQIGSSRLAALRGSFN